ncbi:uncharacterized protein MONBRDRAFT_37532 [Monosiga brevicollis MX1]|uniref:Uncharacterized protein n=1 Tax=Monosiga brevicollis TaxID=81824 RepID=A9V2B2_MONBE|nr:uncharacterized protein MONBRDRAFT_37532 [Monosiga brevicollis MX1]EDQ88344.1 predicted protein [Monosiga brevicollis MX1]|eukprot:XP_001746937.1 hypothetical protein [Monosiga brevicollis MX1]
MAADAEDLVPLMSQYGLAGSGDEDLDQEHVDDHAFLLDSQNFRGNSEQELALQRQLAPRHVWKNASELFPGLLTYTFPVCVFDEFRIGLSYLLVVYTRISLSPITLGVLASKHDGLVRDIVDTYSFDAHSNSFEVKIMSHRCINPLRVSMTFPVDSRTG